MSKLSDTSPFGRLLASSISVGLLTSRSLNDDLRSAPMTPEMTFPRFGCNTPSELRTLYSKYRSTIQPSGNFPESINVLGAKYYNYRGTELISFATSDSTGFIQGPLLLEPPPTGGGDREMGIVKGLRARRFTSLASGTGVPELLRLSGCFRDMPPELADEYTKITELFRSRPHAEMSFEPPMALEKVIALATGIVSRRAYSLTRLPRSWFLHAMWDGMQQLGDAHAYAGQQPLAVNPDMIAMLVGPVTETLGLDLARLQLDISSLQTQTSLRSSTYRSRQHNIRQDLARRNRVIAEQQESSQRLERENQEMARKVKELQEELERLCASL